VFATDLELYGPHAARPKPLSLAKSRRYCRRLARTHYENFTVATWLLPGRLRQHVANVYAYCRWADDLGDEAGQPAQRLALLKWWEQELRDCYAGQVRHPVFVALRETIDRFQIPIQPLLDLLVAFRQDQSVTSYETREQLLDYCRYSANPVGRLVLYLGECCDPQRAALSDSVCTGLQLANFCQDVARDWDIGRVYLPRAECARFKYDEAMFARREASDAFRRLLEFQVVEAEGCLRRGAPLVPMMPRSLRLAVALFVEGGLGILQEIRRQGFDVWTQRPTVTKQHKFQLLARCWWRVARGKFPESTR
jgi:squalene synthase HpnC